ncbi:MAG TPA: AAA family ATPase, partial [Terriglobales bacterium]|nr:AAA family ATPase [Terriglobales bacterium]
SGSEFVEMFVGVGASRVRDMFANAKRDSPSIIFIDEIDSIGRARGTGLGGGHDEREQTLNQILAEMDGFSPHESVVVMAATNRPDILDAALTRPGRFDRQITLDLPQKKARHEILRIHTRNMPLAPDIDLDVIARQTPGFSGADLKNLANEAALLAGRKKKAYVEADDFDQARDKIVLGDEWGDFLTDEDKALVAYHEAGHALVATLLPNADPLKKVSIIPRGRSLGATEQIPRENHHNLSRAYLLNRIAIMLGGRVAERLTFNDITNGAADDLKQATRLARRMVCQWGMSERLGPVFFSRGEEHIFLGRELGEQKDFSEYMARVIDEETHEIMQAMENKTEEILTQNRHKLAALASALIEHESLDSGQIQAVLNGPGMKTPAADSRDHASGGGMAH